MSHVEIQPPPGGVGDATALAAAIAAGELSCVEAMEVALAAAGADACGAVCHLDAGLGLAAAEVADRERRENPERFRARPFAGVPTLAKDLGGPFAGLPVRAGSHLFDHLADPGADSDLAVRYRQAGLCAFGLTTTPEVGLSLTSEPARGPLCRNPLAPALIAGGSSGGAAAAVTSGIVAIAHATDAGGSIRVPAACCGLVGLKATRGAMPSGPHFGNHLAGIASELAVCRSVRDLAAIFRALRGDTWGPYADPPILERHAARLRIGLLTDTGLAWPTAPERLQAVAEAGRSLEAAGHRLVPLAWPRLEASVRRSGAVFADIISANLAALADELKLDMHRAEPLTQAFAERGRALSGAGLWNSLSGAVHVSRDLWELFDDIDCLLAPMLASAPLPLGSFPMDHPDTELHLNRMAAFAPLAALANIAGHPALTLPFGHDPAGLPLPLQLIAPMGHEPTLLGLAARLEAEGRWIHPHPVAGFAG
ncbi:amidase [Labrys miyagiensis]|uniref:Amidase n=1 Tax=Labrys miyagiensis TaxID=346912 RepID=A0ABQ6CT79_9HYPH|nr:amidase [Labrys miyagiensis]GLS23334.1 amidase [Labrys miyagiensis]